MRATYPAIIRAPPIGVTGPKALNLYIFGGQKQSQMTYSHRTLHVPVPIQSQTKDGSRKEKPAKRDSRGSKAVDRKPWVLEKTLSSTAPG